MDVKRFMKDVLMLQSTRRQIEGSFRRHMFTRALQQFIENPWNAINADCSILSRLIQNWGNPDCSALEDYLVAIIEETARTDGPILECGSGLSTIILGVIAGKVGQEVWTLEHSAEWGAKISQTLEEFGLSAVRLCVNPLKNYGDFSWYDPPLDTMPDNFSLVICDGPPGSGHGGRYGLLPVMQNRLATRCTILLDDADRGPERDTAERWLNMLDASMVMGGHGKLFAIIRVGQQRCGQTTAEGGMQPSVTVGIPAYNSETYIRQSIESVLNQTHSNLKLIISDNPSRDKTQENCLHYAKQDARVYYYRQERNIGVFRNYNDVFLKSTSPYFKWQSSSDWCENDALESCIEVLESHPDVVLVCPQVSLVDSHGEQQAYTEDFGLEMDKPEERFMYLLANIQLCNVFNGVIRASALKKTRLNQIFKGSDITLLAELALQGKFVLLPERKWFRRMTPLTASVLKTGAQEAEFFAGEQADLEHYQTWKTLKALTFAVIRAPISVSAKLTCLKFLLRKFFWVRNSLWQEIMRHG